MESFGIEDRKLVARILRTGDFLVVFDGMNERNWDEAIKSFLVRFRNVPVIISSQGRSALTDAEAWTLPPMDETFAKEVLKAHLPSLPDSVIKAVPAGLWAELRSGYDVVLLAELLRAKSPIPASKLELYGATLRGAGARWQGSEPFDRLCTSLYRRAWELWKADGYSFVSSESLPKPFVEHLAEAHILSRAGDSYQFRHELMRQFLCASWLVCESVSTEDLVSRLDDQAIWSMGRTQQREVFRFVAEMLRSPKDLQEVANSAGINIGQRSVLAEAIQARASKSGWSITIPLKTPATT
jgi:hypothetical protein